MAVLLDLGSKTGGESVMSNDTQNAVYLREQMKTRPSLANDCLTEFYATLS